jgi:hypothetical protein
MKNTKLYNNSNKLRKSNAHDKGLALGLDIRINIK